MSNLQKYSANRRNHNTFRSPQNKALAQTKVPSFLRMTTSPHGIVSQSNFEMQTNALKSTNREFLRRTVDATMQKPLFNGFDCAQYKQQFSTGQNYNRIAQQQSGKLELKKNNKNKPPSFLNKNDKNTSCIKNNSLHTLQKKPEDWRRLIIKKVQSQTENSQQGSYVEKISKTMHKIPSFLKKSKQGDFSTPVRKKETDSSYPIQSAHQFHLKQKDSLVTNNSSVFSIRDQQTHELTIQQFKILKKLGQGRFGNVFLAVHQQTNWLTAIKIIKKALIKEHNLQKQFLLETKLQCYFNHPNIVKLYGFFDDKENVYLLVEYMESGTLYEHLKKTKKLTQTVVREKMTETLKAIQCLHQKNVAHRDIKPQNIVLSYDICKICDFGWATICDERRKTLCGTIDYACPQILQGRQYGLSIDLWCLGVLCYQLLTGKAPFYHMSKKKTMQNIINTDKQEVKFPDGISAQAKDMIMNLIVKNPDERLTATQVLKHPFITHKSIVQK